MADSIVVFTAVTRQEILANRGSGDWVLNPERASQCKYLVCCRKDSWTNREEGTPKKAAFLVGVIKKLILHPAEKNSRGQKRYFIEISEYASISKPAVWGNWRNPVRYDLLKNFGFDARSLKFEPIGSAKELTGKKTSPALLQQLTIAEAKKALAATFGVRPEDVEISIRG